MSLWVEDLTEIPRLITILTWVIRIAFQQKGDRFLKLSYFYVVVIRKVRYFVHVLIEDIKNTMEFIHTCLQHGLTHLKTGGQPLRKRRNQWRYQRTSY